MPDVQEKFIFNHSFDELYPLLNRILAIIEQHCASERHEDLRNNCRLVLMELFTNAIRHADVSSTDIDLLINDDHIRISKSDKGKTFYLPATAEDTGLEFPFNSDLTGKKIIIYRDDICCLCGTLHSPDKLIFSAENNDTGTPPSVSGLHEHYGLMIITKIAGEFVYSYDAGTKVNLFSVTLSV